MQRICSFDSLSLGVLASALLLNCGSLNAQTAAVNSATVSVSAEISDGLLGHWPLAGDAKDTSGHQRHGKVHGKIEWNASGPAGAGHQSALFNGHDSWIEVPSVTLGESGKSDFSISLWLHTNDKMKDVPGDLISQYDPESLRGFQLSLKSNSVTTSVANQRQLMFGIDDNQSSEWQDCGRPGNALLAFGLAVHEGSLYAGTCEPGKNESGHVYRYQPAGGTDSDGASGKQWVDCGSPDGSNSVTSLISWRGHLYAGTGKYRVAGSALAESENTTLGGGIFRYLGDTRWESCGQLPMTEAIGGLVEFDGNLYASSLYRPAGFYRFDGQSNWTDCGTPDGKRVVALGVYNGHLYATSYDGGYVYRYDGTAWTDCGRLGENTQTYSFAVCQGRLYVGTWPSGRVYRFEDLNQWTDVGRLGEELEVMGMLVHNGRLIAGTLPLAEVYSWDHKSTWKKLTRLDHTPDVKYRRAWTMAEYQGRLFCSTLPTGKIFSFEAGRNVMASDSLASGWHHIAAVKSNNRLSLYTDGKLVSKSAETSHDKFSLNSGASLKIGFGQNDFLAGGLSDVRLYERVLSENEIQQLASKSPTK